MHYTPVQGSIPGTGGHAPRTGFVLPFLQEVKNEQAAVPNAVWLCPASGRKVNYTFFMGKLPLSVYPARVLIQTIRECRQAQKQYFRDKSPTSLRWAKQVETRLDKLLLAIDETQVQPTPGWETERGLAAIMGIRDETQWLFALEQLATEHDKAEIAGG